MTATEVDQACGPAMQKMLTAFPQLKYQSNGWYSNPDNPRFDCREQSNGWITLHSWNNRSDEEILAMGGLTLADVRPGGYRRTLLHDLDNIDLVQLAYAKKIHWSFLINLGIADNYPYHGRKYVKIPSFLADGSQHTKIRVRKAISGEYKQCWDEGTPGEIIPYGLDRLGMARIAGYLFIGEGETDAWACWSHDLPYLGIPGATLQKSLRGIDLNEIPVIYILIEPDQFRSMLSNGQGFYKNVHNMLRSQGYTGQIFCIDFKKVTSYKDPSELHIELWECNKSNQFADIMAHARKKAIPANDQIGLDQVLHVQRKRAGTSYKIVPHPVEADKVAAYLADAEYGDALLFAEAFKGLVCYDRTAKKWYLWNGDYWIQDTKGKAELLISGELGAIYLRLCADLNPKLAELQKKLTTSIKDALKSENTDVRKLAEEALAIEELMEALRKRAIGLRTAKRNRSVQMFIQSMLSVTSDMWDTGPWILATANGVIDLKTGEHKHGDPEDYIQTVSPTTWEGIDATCPRFERFLEEIFANIPEKDRRELISFLRRLFGHALVGKVSNAIFPILYGEEGRNGKDTLIATLKSVLGPLAGAISNDVFLAQEKGRAAGAATPHLMDLQGKRLVWGSETKQGDKINVAQIKLLTGGGDISGRRNFGDQYAFTPSHTLLLMTNYKPHADAKDKAFWARVCLIEFGLRFVEDPQAKNERKADTELVTTLKQEAPGILAWLVRGCLEWQQEGLAIPESVKLATDAYRESEDALQTFIEACCIIKKDAKAGATHLYDAYVSWSKQNNINYMSGIQFGKDMGKRFEKKRTNSGQMYIGIGIIDPKIDDGVYDRVGSVYSLEESYTPDETAPEATPEGSENGRVYDVYSFSKRSEKTTSLPPVTGGGIGKTIHTIHETSGDISNKTAPEAMPDGSENPSKLYTNHTQTLHDHTLCQITLPAERQVMCHMHPDRPSIDKHKRCEECLTRFSARVEEIASLAESMDWPRVRPGRLVINAGEESWWATLANQTSEVSLEAIYGELRMLQNGSANRSKKR